MGFLKLTHPAVVTTVRSGSKHAALRFRTKAQMAELVDALASGASYRKVVEVQVLFWAPFQL